jgi:three-Cys-motif partner protein
MENGGADGDGDDPYDARLQTKAKHFILEHYLKALAYKVLTFTDLTYVDGFSGPWKTETENFADSSFMIAIKALQQAQADMATNGKKRKIRLFLSELDPKAYSKLKTAVAPFHKPAEGFEIITFGGTFEDAIPEIEKAIGKTFPLIFIDPTGWTGFGFDKIKSLFNRPKVEVLINFMFAFVSRFVNDDRPHIIGSLDPILGGPGWRDRLDKTLPRGLAVEKLFRETLKQAGVFPFVVSTKIDKSTENRPHFFLVYGSKSAEGLKAFRETEFTALKKHVKDRANAKEKKKAEKSQSGDLFAGHEAEVQEQALEDIVAEQKKLAAKDLVDTLQLRGEFKFEDIVAPLLQAYMLRETDVKNICVQLAAEGTIENTWGAKPRKPKDGDVIRSIPKASKK